MALPFSLRNGTRDPAVVRREEHERLLKTRRREVISKQTTAGIKQSMRHIKKRISNGHTEKGKLSMNVYVDHWLPRSVDRVMHYSKIGNPQDPNDAERQQAIREDIQFFLDIVRHLQVQSRGWKIEPRYADKAKTIPNQILVLKE